MMDDEEEAPRLALSGAIYMTPAGHARLRTELDALRTERQTVVDIVSWAASNGDRSENADYQYGKRRLREIDRRLRYLLQRLEKAQIVDPARQTMRDRVLFGATVTYIDETGTERTVTIVGSDEADMAQGTISLTSPVAVALIKLRARVGDEVCGAHTQGCSADRGTSRLLSRLWIVVRSRTRDECRDWVVGDGRHQMRDNLGRSQIFCQA